MARLTAINYGSRERRPQTPGPGSVVFEYAQRQRVSDALFGVAEELADKKLEQDSIDADIGLHEDLEAFEQQHAAQEDRGGYADFEADDFPIGKLRGRENIPAFEVKPFALERTLRESIDERARHIDNPAARQAWKNKAELHAVRLVHQAGEASRSQARAADAQRAKHAVELYQSTGAHDEASETIDAMAVSKEFKTLLHHENSQHRELYRITGLSQGENYTAMQKELETLHAGESSLDPSNTGKAITMLTAGHRRALGQAMADEGEVYFDALRSEDWVRIESLIDELRADDYQGVLEAPERNTWITRMESGLRQITAGQLAQERALIAQSKRDITRASRLLETGEAIDPTEINLVAQEVDRVRAIDPDAPEVLAFDDARAEYGFVTEMQALSLREQAERLGDLRGDRSIEGIDRYNRAVKVHAQANEALATDSMAYANRIGFYSSDVLPPVESPAFVEALAERNWADQRIEAHFGKSSGPLTAVEADLFSDTREDPVLLADQVRVAMGERAPLFWEQLVKSNPAAHMIAGEIASRPGAEADLIARRVLAGRSARASLEWTESHYRTLRFEVSERLGDVYGTDAGTRKAYTSAAIDLYIAEKKRAGESQYLTPHPSMGLTVDRDAMRDAVEAVTGGMIEHEGVTLLAPEPGVTERQFDDWIDGLTVEDLPYARQASREELLERIQNGDLQLRQSRQGRKAFVLYDTYSGSLLASAGDTREPAVLRWP